MQTITNHLSTEDGYHWYAVTVLSDPPTIIAMLKNVVSGETFYPLSSMATLMGYDSVEELMTSNEMQDAMLVYTEKTGRPAIVYIGPLAITPIQIPAL